MEQKMAIIGLIVEALDRVGAGPLWHSESSAPERGGGKRGKGQKKSSDPVLPILSFS